MASVLEKIVRDIALDDSKNTGMKLARGRDSDFGGNLEMMLAGAVYDPASRAMLETRLGKHFEAQDRKPLPTTTCEEVIIGGGLHAAVYCAVRAAAGKPQPLVLTDTRPGGAFAMSRKPSFYLNSGNRPGTSGLPGEEGALNYLPGFPLQPSMISNAEYQPNTDLALAIRLALTEYADVRTCRITGVEDLGADARVITEDGRAILAYRVLDMRGAGEPNTKGGTPNGATILSFPQFMARLDEAFPFRGVETAAVVGSGDSARCAVEALLGIGPARHMSVPGLDFVTNVDWYANLNAVTCQAWRQTERGRYQRIGSYLPQPEDRRDAGNRTGARLNIFTGKPVAVPTFGGATVAGRTYPLVVTATGNTPPALYITPTTGYSLDGLETLGRRAGRRYYVLGPAARLPFNERERLTTITRIPANAAAVFRLAPRTATAAANLP